MNENVKAILEKLNREPELLEKIKEEAIKNPPRSKEDILELADKYGFKLTEADLSFGKDLTEEELKQAAGGKGELADAVGEACGTATCILCGLPFGIAFLGGALS